MNRITGSLANWSDHLALLWRSRRILIVAQSGQGLAEYALILALIAIVAIIALVFLGHQVSKILSIVGKSV